MKKIFVIAHALTEPRNRDRWVELAKQFPSYHVSLLVPRIWRSNWFGKEVITQTEFHEEDNFRILPLNVTDERRWTLFITPKLPLLLLKEKPDYIICYQEQGTIALCWSLICQKLFSRKSKIGFFSWQNIEIHREKWHQKLRWYLSKKLSDFFIAGTEEIKELFEKSSYPNKIFVQTEIGVSPSLFHQDLEKRQSFRNKYQLGDSFTIGFAGRLVDQKGIFDLDAAFSMLPPNLNAKLVWAGDGQERKKLEQSNSNYIFLGQMDLADMVDFYNGIDCLVLPSKTTREWKEQFGLVIPQALCCNTPVIGSSSGAIPEVVGNDDYIFQEGDSDELMKKIVAVFNGELSPISKAEKFQTPNLSHSLIHLLDTIDKSPSA